VNERTPGPMVVSAAPIAITSRPYARRQGPIATLGVPMAADGSPYAASKTVHRSGPMAAAKTCGRGTHARPCPRVDASQRRPISRSRHPR
jgi:hypothetical protein